MTRVALAEVQHAIDELRVLAHGINPAVLAEAGLGAALDTLADIAPVPLELIEVPYERFSPAVERTAYAVVAAVVETAQRKATSACALRISANGSSLIIAVGGGGDPPLTDIGDRVGALGGQVTVEGSLLRVEIPCA
jgi:signal transduction histidine kinase